MIGLMIEILVCVLLAATIGWSVVLDRRLRALKADEQAMRKTIVDLVAATDKAERAVAGLRQVVTDCDRSIAGQLHEAERQSVALAAQIRSGDEVIARIGRIVETARGAAPAAPETPAPSRLAATLAAAQALAERAQRRVPASEAA
ncbi:DUF6468 domain-containing protein [Alsobacter sp. SYSU M60028]|uniref:DUF6468 domain-containing protein n=1 Tax=Alsobacter ponti TaxID=2962936 RepID=A0ABT1L8D3_9HYPH|nr:DUF6468 domain-containing protein [Alsobacter ponti]MCP8937331.1 DUF6468 domain-containing protein [Alsobacter ponti]